MNQPTRHTHDNNRRGGKWRTLRRYVERLRGRSWQLRGGLPPGEGLPQRGECLQGVGIVNNASDLQGIRQLADPQIAELSAVSALVSDPKGGSGTRRLLRVVRRLADILQVTVVLAERSDAHWEQVVSQVLDRPQPEPDADFWRVVEQASTLGEVRTVTARRNGRWTVLPLALTGTRRAALLLAGDWRLAAATLSSLGDQLSAAFHSPRPSAAGLRRASHQLSQRLAETHGVGPVCNAIVEAMAAAVRARVAAMATVDPVDRRLSIKATHGYPLILVEHLQIESGEGILGAALQTGRVQRPARGGNGSSPGRRRPRYRTDSYVALPLLAGREVLGVVSVADRVDDQPFTRSDLSAMWALAAPSALALARERAAARAEAYAHAAAIDPLSGLFNRRYFHVRLEEELQRSRRHEIPLALLMIDVDDFKSVNDSYGHLAGDLIIKETAEIVRRAVRVFDVCTRFGGEEFAVIMPASGEEAALAVAERIRARMAAYRAPDRPLEDLRVSVSIGVALGTETASGRDLIQHADAALYAAKRGGKNRVRLYVPGQA